MSRGIGTRYIKVKFFKASLVPLLLGMNGFCPVSLVISDKSGTGNQFFFKCLREMGYPKKL